MTTLNEPLMLRHGAPLPNRIAKAAMEELLAAPGQVPGDRLIALYRRWAAGGAGLLITGHVMIDGRAVAQPGDVVLERDTPLEPFRRWAAAGRSAGGRIWMQINHPGRVIPKDLADITWGPSAVPIDAGGFSRLYPTPRPMTARAIAGTVERFAVTARRAQQAGFDGVQIHAAHGYLLSQFLSPLVNRREDRWGGSLHRRARFLLDVVGAVRERVGTGFAVGVKLNSADFQRGGFDTDDAREVIEMLDDAGVDLVELSGGSIESLATAGSPADGRTLAREAYFLELAEQLVATSPVPLLLTGGIRRRAVAERVIGSGVAVAGLATALAIDPALPERWLAGGEAQARPPRTRIRNKALAAAAVQAATSRRLAHLATGRSGRAPCPAALALLVERLVRARRRRAYETWRATR
ncbi:NADH:flavin oxidoreductase/NADH oxidase family protein [Streptomyces harbinensis]|uniref:NADH:flavin oxidoreductase/NADH oxidase family protein n=1 Tax=Streptomyces harbinensis TaxID=1176198 RepID=UPI0015923400|nr:NADH:flavin oxidoreductase/NADH oxidase family protein [Streptomyces harbinensis]QKV71873.1 NADH:flavin oxidoreductase/NADH oxidase family protein [Streptomyces harbinensis]